MAWGRIFWNSGAFPCIQRRDRRQVWSPDSDRRKLLTFIAAVCLSHRVRLILSFYVDECLPFTAATFDRARHLCRSRAVPCSASLTFDSAAMFNLPKWSASNLWPVVLYSRHGRPTVYHNQICLQDARCIISTRWRPGMTSVAGPVLLPSLRRRSCDQCDLSVILFVCLCSRLLQK